MQEPTDDVMALRSYLNRQHTCSPLCLLLLQLGNRHVHLPAAVHLALLLRLLNTASNSDTFLRQPDMSMAAVDRWPRSSAAHPVIARWYLTTTSSIVRSIASSTAGYFFVKRAAPSCDSRTVDTHHTP